MLVLCEHPFPHHPTPPLNLATSHPPVQNLPPSQRAFSFLDGPPQVHFP
jgi:hypothetical protein